MSERTSGCSQEHPSTFELQRQLWFCPMRNSYLTELLQKNLLSVHPSCGEAAQIPRALPHGGSLSTGLPCPRQWM